MSDSVARGGRSASAWLGVVASFWCTDASALPHDAEVRPPKVEDPEPPEPIRLEHAKEG